MSSVNHYDFTMTKASMFRIFYGSNIEHKVTTEHIAATEPYPNPLTNELGTTINLSLPNMSGEYQVRCLLLNSQGKLIESANHSLKPGIHSLKLALNSLSLTGGIYFYRLAVSSEKSSQIFAGKIVKP